MLTYEDCITTLESKGFVYWDEDSYAYEKHEDNGIVAGVDLDADGITSISVWSPFYEGVVSRQYEVGELEECLEFVDSWSDYCTRLKKISFWWGLRDEEIIFVDKEGYSISCYLYDFEWTTDPETFLSRCEESVLLQPSFT